MKIPAFFILLTLCVCLNGYTQTPAPVSPKDTLAFEVQVFPNPSPSRRFSVAINGQQVTKVQVQVLDALQRVIFQKEITPTYGLSLHSLNLSDRPKGWYYLVIITNETKIIKRLEGL
ncbi:hypothetical protein BKI52_40215 [marine bacterium AO1-C]|nr:hypothetical protein BKI52_40215 [marine bacterium AO1-C]